MSGKGKKSSKSATEQGPETDDGSPTTEELLAAAAAKGDSAPVDAELKKIFHPFQQEAVCDVEVDMTKDDAAMETDRKGLLKRIKDFVGSDLTRIAIPVYFNEPTSFLHRAAETTEHFELLAKAVENKDNLSLRLAYIAAFAIAAYSAAERTTKPFNPLLGETFEWTTDTSRFVAEQVSHHPPACAAHLETADFEWWQYKSVKANFTGNAVTSPPLGSTLLKFKGEDATYEWGGLNSCIHNLIVGRMWIDHYGTFTIVSDKSEAKAEVTFTQCGWFSRGWHKVLATIYDEYGNVTHYVGGLWHEKLELWDAEHGKDIEKVPEEVKTLVWTKPPMPEEGEARWRGFTKFMDSLCELSPELMETLPRTDARFRPDILELAKQNYRLAGQEKYKLEEIQRSERKKREAGELPPWKHRYFEEDGNGGYRFTGTYWTEREQRLKAKGISIPGPIF